MICLFNMHQIVSSALHVNMDCVLIRNALKTNTAPKVTNVKVVFAVR